MRRVSNQRQLRLVTEISITPFMDLVLVLLLVLFVSVPLLKAGRSLLPITAAPAPVTPPPQTVTVLQVNADQSVTLDGAILARVNLPGALKQFSKDKPDIGVEVRIHQALPVQHLLETMSMLEEAGIQKTAVTSHNEPP